MARESVEKAVGRMFLDSKWREMFLADPKGMSKEFDFNDADLARLKAVAEIMNSSIDLGQVSGGAWEPREPGNDFCGSY